MIRKGKTKSNKINNCVFMSKEILQEVRKREEEAGFIPDRDIDLYMKVQIYICFYKLIRIVSLIARIKFLLSSSIF